MDQRPSNPNQPPQGQPFNPQYPSGQYPSQPQGYQQGNYPPVPPQGYPQFPQGYPPVQQYQQPPVQPPTPPKKKRRGLLIGAVVLVVALALCGIVGSVFSHSATTATTTTASTTSNATKAPTEPPVAKKWTTTHTFKGTGIQKTDVFSVGDTWKLAWTCDPASFAASQYNVIVTVYGADNNIRDVAVNALCKQGSTSGTTTEHNGGQIFLDINSESDWNFTVSELK